MAPNMSSPVPLIGSESVRCIDANLSPDCAKQSLQNVFPVNLNFLLSTSKYLLNISENAYASLPSMEHGLVGDVLRGVRISTHLQNQSLLVQALQSRTTNLERSLLPTQTQPLQFSCTSLAKLCRFFFGHVCRPGPLRSSEIGQKSLQTPLLDTEHRTRIKKQFLSLNRSRMMQYHQILANKRK